MSFENFLKTFPPETDSILKVESRFLTAEISREFTINVPYSLAEFWEEVGSGYFGNREIYFFGDGLTKADRDSLVGWNKKEFWQEIGPRPKDGGPLFFAETCFGDQLGFRWEGRSYVIILFDVNSFESFIIATDFDQLFSETLNDRYAFYNQEEFESVRERLGDLPKGMHYAPIISPLIGGTENAENFFITSPEVHFRTAVAEYRALNGK